MGFYLEDKEDYDDQHESINGTESTVTVNGSLYVNQTDIVSLIYVKIVKFDVF